MPAKGMGHALEEIHRLLNPCGSLVDIHPVAEPSTLLVVRDGEVLYSREIPESSFESYLMAGEALDQWVQQKKFARASCDQFVYEYFASSAQELQEYISIENAYAASSDGDEEMDLEGKEIFSAAETALVNAGPGAEVGIQSRAYITHLKLVK